MTDKPTADEFRRKMMHPLAIRGNQSGANGMCAGDRVRHIDGRTGIADEFLHDGDALITWDDGTFGVVRWHNLTKGLEGMTTTPNPTADEARLRDHETIWLGPNCEDRGEDRCWAPDNPWGDGCDECGEKPVKFVRADLYAAALARAEAAEKALEPFAKAAAFITEEFSDLDSTEFALLEEQQPTVGDLRRAARALSAAGGQ